MFLAQPLDYLPLWGIFVGTMVVVLLSLEGGFRLGRLRLRYQDKKNEAPVGTMVGATLGLLAFLLAFTFGMSASRFDQRRQIVLDEANAIQTAYLRSALVAEPARSAIRGLLREYVTIRVEGLKPEKVGELILRSEALHEQLWVQVVALGESGPGSSLTRLLVQSLNDVIDLHTKRVTTGLHNRVPGVIWGMLYFVALLAMALLGYQSGLSGTRSTAPNLAIVLAYAVVMLLVVDLDRPQHGLLTVNQQVMIDLRSRLNTQAP